jgi:cation/acetate symporter
VPSAIFPFENPAIFSMSAAFLVRILVSLVIREKQAEAKFEEEKLRTYIGIGGRIRILAHACAAAKVAHAVD